MRWRNFVLLAVISLAGVSSAHAQHEYEITPFFGTRIGGNIDVSGQGYSNVDYLKIKNSEDFGVMAGINFWGHLEGEFMWNRQPTSLSAHNPNDGTYAYQSPLNLDMYQFDILYHFTRSDAKFRPYAVGGLGFSRFGSMNNVTQNLTGFNTSFSFNMGAGVKYFFTDHFGIRVEARWSPSQTTQGVGQACSYYGGCYSTPITNLAEQGQANIGLIFRFKK